ncbi:chitinase [Mariannaea sp. PMI_226]|nr:chitinase [Mariannaea sp. PMI_226]
MLFCSKGCQGTCDQKSDCNPGWKETIYSKFDKCPLNVCCSKSGFCGYTEEFCKDDKVKRPSCSIGNTPVSRVIGYYESWATSKRRCYAMKPEEIPFGVYTHLIFSFATVNPKTFEVSPGNYETEDMMTRISTIKLVQPDIKIIVAIGGWAFNDPGPTQTSFSDMASSTVNIDAFINSLSKMMNKYGLDGIDIDWEYPVAKDRHGKNADYKNVVTFMKRLRTKMTSMRKSVSMAIPASYWYLQHFDIKALENAVDWFNFMTYDMHGAWDIDNKWTGPWANSHTNLTEIQQGLDLLWRNDIDPKKVTVGMAYYSRSFTLANANCNNPGCRVSSSGLPGKCSGTSGVLLHPEIQDIIKEKKLTPVLDKIAAVKTLSWGNQWTTIDDVVTWRLKGNSLRSQCITGFMVWAMSQDDPSGTNAKGLVSALGRPKVNFPDFTPNDPKPEAGQNTGSCRWSSCFDGCPSGFKEVQRDGHEEIMLDSSRCNGFGHGFTRLCCPSSAIPTCSWRGHHNSGHCTPGCHNDEVEVGTLSTGCHKNHQSACCTKGPSTDMYSKCIWFPCSDLGNDACNGSFSHYMAASSIGFGGLKSCKDTQKYSLCCSEPPPDELAGKCHWQDKVGFLDAPNMKSVCEGACPKGEIRLALEDGLNDSLEAKAGCFGDLAFCCSKKSDLIPRGDDDGFGSSQAKQFRALVDAYLDNPTCPATILHPPLHDPYGNGGAATKRSLEIESRTIEILQGRAKDCSLDNWIRLVQFATLMFTMKDTGYDPIRTIWDDELADTFDEDLRFANLQDYLYDQVSLWEPRGLVEYVLYNPLAAGPGLRRGRRVTETFCDLPTHRRRGEKARTDLHPRRIWPWGGGRNDIPGLKKILEGIQRGHLTLHYARWEWYNGGRSGLPPGPMLELAYWIGPEPGIIDPDEDLNDYRDNSWPRSVAEPDRWVVFHLHMDPETEWLREIQGRTYVGITSVQFFHSQWVNQRGSTVWRAQGAGQRATRDGIDCPVDLRSVWYIGSPRDFPTDGVSAEDLRVMEALQSWGEVLFNQGYVGFPAMSLILNQFDNTATEIDPHNPGELVYRGGSSDRANGGDPYGINWLWTGHGYNFHPPPPPPGVS